MTSAHDILQTIGRQQLAQALGVGLTTISNAAVRNEFPSSWYPTIQLLALKNGTTVPGEMFGWKCPDDALLLQKQDNRDIALHTGNPSVKIPSEEGAQ